MSLDGNNAQAAQQPQRKGEVGILREALREMGSYNDDKKRQVLQKVIEFMTAGLDLSKLMGDMIMACNTRDIVQKKMVYLFLQTYANSNQELALLVINNFRNDCKDENAIVRGLALRTISSLRVPNIVEYIVPLIKSGLNDTSPYVRKVAIIACAKLHTLSPDIVRYENLVDRLYTVIRDGDSQVAINAVAALNEILKDDGGVNLNKAVVYYLLNRMKTLNEWQLCAVLELLLKYTPKDENEMFDIMTLLDERLKNANSAVVLGCAKILLHYTSNMKHVHLQVYMRLKVPLLTLVSASSAADTSYAVLQHIRILAARQPQIFSDSYKTFYCRYSDPSPVKEVKLEILTYIVNEANAKDIMEELSEYVGDVDEQTSRLAIRTFGQIAVVLPPLTESCLNQLLNFLDMEVEHVRSEIFVVLKDILRKYDKRQFCSIFLPSIAKHWMSVDSVQSKISFLWIIGEYGELVSNSPQILQNYAESFKQEEQSVKAMILTSAMRLFFKLPGDMQQTLGRLLKDASDDSNVDLRDKALLYYRLLRRDVIEAQRVANTPKEFISNFSEEESSEYKDRVFEEFNSFSVIYNQPSERFAYVELPELDEENDDEESEATPSSLQEENANQNSQLLKTDEGEEEDSYSVSSYSTQYTNNQYGNHQNNVSPFGNAKSTSNNLLDLYSPPTPTQMQQHNGLPGLMAFKNNTFRLAAQPDLKPQEFQKKWGIMNTNTIYEHKLRGQPYTYELENCLRQHNICTVASGVINDVMKFYAYGQQEGMSEYFLLEGIIGSDGKLVSKIKCDNPENLNLFMDKLIPALSAL